MFSVKAVPRTWTCRMSCRLASGTATPRTGASSSRNCWARSARSVQGTCQDANEPCWTRQRAQPCAHVRCTACIALVLPGASWAKTYSRSATHRWATEAELHAVLDWALHLGEVDSEMLDTWLRGRNTSGPLALGNLPLQLQFKARPRVFWCPRGFALRMRGEGPPLWQAWAAKNMAFVRQDWSCILRRPCA